MSNYGDDIDRADLRLDLEVALRSLTELERQTVTAWLRGATQQEIADMQGVTQPVICERLSIALRKLLVEMHNG